MIETMQLSFSVSMTCGLLWLVFYIVSAGLNDKNRPEWFLFAAGLNVIVCIATLVIGGLIWIWA